MIRSKLRATNRLLTGLFAATALVGSAATLILDSTQTSADVTVGRTIVFNVENPAAWTLSADPADLVQLTPGGESGGATFNPGATALAAGSVTITLTNETSGEVLTFAISIK